MEDQRGGHEWGESVQEEEMDRREDCCQYEDHAGRGQGSLEPGEPGGYSQGEPMMTQGGGSQSWRSGGEAFWAGVLKRENELRFSKETQVGWLNRTFLYGQRYVISCLKCMYLLRLIPPCSDPVRRCTLRQSSQGGPQTGWR